MNSRQKGRRSQSNRKKISDTTALSVFIRQPPLERQSSRSRHRSAAGVMASRGRGSSGRAGPEQLADASNLPKANVSGITALDSVVAAVKPKPAEDADVDVILRRGGLRLMQNMSVYLTRDEQIILADPSSGMAALVTGVSKVGDTELATIAEAQKAIQELAAAPAIRTSLQLSPTDPVPVPGAGAPTNTKTDAKEPVKSEADAEPDPGIGSLEGALAGLLALKNGEIPGDCPATSDVAGEDNTPATTTTSSPSKRERTAGAGTSGRSKRSRAASPPITRPRSAAGTRRSRGSPPPSSSTAVPSVAPVTTQSVPPVVPSTAAAASQDTLGPAVAAPITCSGWPVPTMTPQTVLPALQSLQLLPAALVSLAGTLSSGGGTEAGAQWAEASKLTSGALADSTAMLPPGSSGMASSGTAVASVHAGAPPSLSHLLHASGVGGCGATAAGVSSPELAIDSLSNLDPPQLAVAAGGLVPVVPLLQHSATLPAPLQGLLSSRDAPTGEDASAAVGSGAVAHTVFAPPVAEGSAADALASRAGSIVGGMAVVSTREMPGRAGSSINSLPGAVSAETAPEGEQSQNVSEGVPRGMAVEYTSRAGAGSAQLRGAPLRQTTAAGMLNLSGGGTAAKGANVAIGAVAGAAAAVGGASAAGGAAATSSGATLGGEDMSGRASALKQDDADTRTLQRRARNRDAARRTRMKKMMLLQGGEAKVMALVEEVQERTAELLEVKRQVAEAEALHEHLRAQLATRETGAVEKEPRAVEPKVIENQAVEATV
eukprot:jgi/Ulvmu1/413/UM001_0420.1